MCLKKAAHFNEWLAREGACRFFLMASWREMKGCLQHCCAGDGARPLAVFLVSRNEATVDRVRRFCVELPWRSSPLHLELLAELGPVQPFVEGLCAKLQAAPWHPTPSQPPRRAAASTSARDNVEEVDWRPRSAASLPGEGPSAVPCGELVRSEPDGVPMPNECGSDPQVRGFSF